MVVFALLLHGTVIKKKNIRKVSIQVQYLERIVTHNGDELLCEIKNEENRA